MLAMCAQCLPPYWFTSSTSCASSLGHHGPCRGGERGCEGLSRKANRAQRARHARQLAHSQGRSRCAHLDILSIEDGVPPVHTLRRWLVGVEPWRAWRVWLGHFRRRRRRGVPLVAHLTQNGDHVLTQRVGRVREQVHGLAQTSWPVRRRARRSERRGWRRLARVGRAAVENVADWDTSPQRSS